jgi:MerR family copper efflux transcriptional regulator
MPHQASTKAGAPLSIGALSRLSGVGVDAIRFYERKGLLPPAARRASGYRVYVQRDAERLGFIRRAQTFGFSLEEIAVLLRSRDGTSGVAAAKALAQEKLAALEVRAAELLKLKADLALLVDHCPGSGDAADCPILGAFESAPVRPTETP